MRCLFFGTLLCSSLLACGGSHPTSPSQSQTGPTTQCSGGQAAAPITNLTIAGPEIVPTGSIVKYDATATLSNNCGTISHAQATWTVDDVAVASIDSNGALTANRQGAVTITATYREKSTTAAVHVTAETAARTHVDEILGLMQANSLNRTTINWDIFRRQVTAAVGAGPTIPNAYPAIRLALELLNDRDSFYLSSDKQQRIESPSEGCGPPPGSLSIPTLPGTIGYVRVPPFSGEAEAERTQFAESIQEAIRVADRPGLIGWIVDLRGNVGGTMWPMIAGIGPILGEGVVGWIMYPDREYANEYRGGAAQSLGEVFARVRQPYTLMQPNPRVAVLTDGAVISAGEAIAVYFRGRPATRSFGAPTCGHHHLYNAVNDAFFLLSDGAYLALVGSEHADRTKTRYRGPIYPDEFADPTQGIDRAIAWLQGGS